MVDADAPLAAANLLIPAVDPEGLTQFDSAMPPVDDAGSPAEQLVANRLNGFAVDLSSAEHYTPSPRGTGPVRTQVRA